MYEQRYSCSCYFTIKLQCYSSISAMAVDMIYKPLSLRCSTRPWLVHTPPTPMKEHSMSIFRNNSSNKPWRVILLGLLASIAMVVTNLFGGGTVAQASETGPSISV